MLPLTLVSGAPEEKPAAARRNPGTAGTIVVPHSRITLIKDQPVACGRMGVLEFVGRQEAVKDQNGETVTQVVELRPGDDVKEGDVIAQIIDDVAEASYNVALAEASSDVEIRFQKKAQEVAKAEYESALQTNMRVPGAIAEIEIKKFKLAAEKGGLAVEQAELQAKILKLKAEESARTLDTFKIRAPFDGRVTNLLKSKGEAVREGDPILEMANTDIVRVEGYVNVQDKPLIKRFMKVLVQIEEDDGTLSPVVFAGKIVFIDEKVQAVTQEVRVRAEVANPEGGLLANRTAMMKIQADTRVTRRP